MSQPPQIALSSIDEERFGIRTARALNVTSENLPIVLDFCRSYAVKMLIARCLVDDLRAVQDMEIAGFQLMDTLLYYSRNLTQTPIPIEQDRVLIRYFQPSDEEIVKAIAAESFQGYRGHYHADSRLNRAKCDEAYISWAVRSCSSREVANEVLVADRDGEVLGFATLKLNTPRQGEGVLFGVSPKAQGQGIYRSLMIHGMNWCASTGAQEMVVSTQVTNRAVQKVWVRLGFEPHHAYYTLHKWFDWADNDGIIHPV